MDFRTDRALNLTRSEAERFLRMCEPEPNSGCWIWIGSRREGYGQFRFGGKSRKAHRYSYERAYGSAPPELDHLCRLTCCVNPRHLEPVTSGENKRRAAAAAHAQGRLWRSSVVMDWPQIQAAYLGGLSLSTLARQVGIHRLTLRREFARRGQPLRARAARSKCAWLLRRNA